MRKLLLSRMMLLLCALMAGGGSAWAEVPENPVWVATALASINDNATVIIISNSDNATNIALPSTETSSSPAKVACTVTTTDGVTTITPPTGKTIQDLAWTISKITGTSTTYKFYQEGSSTIRLYLTNTTGNTALRIGGASSSNDQFVLGDLGKLLKVTTGARYVGPYDNSGNDWRTYNTENATNYKNAALTFYVLKETKATTTTITSTGITNTDLKNGTAAGALSASVTVTSGGAAVDGASVTWTSSNTNVATVASDGTVSLLGTGSTTITASYAGNSTYSASSATYNLTVTDTRVATTTTISDAGLTNVDLKNGTAAGSLSANVKVTSTNTAIDGVTVTWTSSDEDVATIASDGTITLVAVGIATITASYAGGGDYSSSSDTYELTVTDTRQDTKITIDNWNTLFGTSFSGSLSGTNLKDYNGSSKNVVVDYKKGTGSNMYITNSELRAYSGNSLVFTAPSGYILTSIEFTKGSNWNINSATPGTISSQTWTAASNTASVTFGFSGRTDIKSVVVNLAETATITLSSACTDGTKYYGTYSNGSAFVVPSDLTVSTIGVSGGKLTVSDYETGDVVKANTGVMVSSATSGNHTVTLTAATGTELEGNMLKASGDAGIEADDMDEDDTKFYRLTMHDGTTIGFWWGAADGAAFNLAANKAYLAVPDAAAARIQSFWLDGETAGISSMHNSQCIMHNEVYDLQGRRVESSIFNSQSSILKKGLYIVNGKKVIK